MPFGSRSLVGQKGRLESSGVPLTIPVSKILMFGQRVGLLQASLRFGLLAFQAAGSAFRALRIPNAEIPLTAKIAANESDIILRVTPRLEFPQVFHESSRKFLRGKIRFF